MVYASQNLHHSNASLTANGTTPPVLLWLFFPPIMITFALISRAVSPEFYDTYVYGELGIVENATVLFLFPAVIMGIFATNYSRILDNRLITLWFFIQTLGMFYFMGEEASWGQHWFGWENEGIFANHPRGETNIHNTNHWFDQKPKVLVELWTIVGGVIVPLWLWFKGRHLNQPSNLWTWVWPTVVCLPTAVIGLIVKNIERVREALHLSLPSPFDIRFSELQEFYFALFFFLYMLALFMRIRAVRAERS